MERYFLCPQSGLKRDLFAEREREAKRSNAIKAASMALESAAISRICARYELESDEFMTAEQKAKEYL